jgi:hypothetical protein
MATYRKALYGGDVRDAEKLEGKNSMAISEGFKYNEKFKYNSSIRQIPHHY